CGRNSARTLERRQFFRRLLLGELDAPLDIAHSVEVLIHLCAITRSEPGQQPIDLLIYEIQNAAVLANARQAFSGVRAVAVAEEPLEDSAWTVLHRQRSGGSAPTERVGIGTTVRRNTLTDDFSRLDAQLQRRQFG